MYTNVLRVELCGMWLVGLCALALVACGDDSEGGGGGDTVAGTPCTIGGTEAETKIDGCPTTPTMCSMAGGTVTRVCHTPGATPALPAAPAAGSRIHEGMPWIESDHGHVSVPSRRLRLYAPISR
jgi:hypothetical protein